MERKIIQVYTQQKNVGIGTTTADAALTVGSSDRIDGNARITGITTMNNTVVGSATTELIVSW